MTFGENLRMLRNKQNLTQNDVACYLKITRQSISKWESDKSIPSIIYIVPLTQVLCCTLENLFLYNKEGK